VEGGGDGEEEIRVESAVGRVAAWIREGKRGPEEGWR